MTNIIVIQIVFVLKFIFINTEYLCCSVSFINLYFFLLINNFTLSIIHVFLTVQRLSDNRKKLNKIIYKKRPVRSTFPQRDARFVFLDTALLGLLYRYLNFLMMTILLLLFIVIAFFTLELFVVFIFTV